MARTLLRLFDQKKPGSDNIGIKKEVRAASTANIATLEDEITVDGVSLSAGDRVLVKDQTDPTENGIYVVVAGANPWTRALDADELGEVFGGEVVFVSEGTANGGSGWINTTTGAITPGTTAQTFAKFTTMNAVTSSSFIIGELPSGTINGSNVTFTLANTPLANKFALYYNGQRLRAGGTEDYTISGNTITLAFAPKSNPGQTDVLLADYLF